MSELAENANHPPAHVLDAMAAGDDASAETEAHVAQCEACEAYVEELRTQAIKFRETANGADFAEKIAEIGKIEDETAKVISSATANIVPRPPPHADEKSNVFRFPGWAYVGVPLLAAAAAMALFLNSSSLVPSHDSPPSQQTAQDMARFKGQLPVVVIRDREGRQDRLEGPFTMRAGDRIRIELNVDHAQPLTAGLLSEDGTWVALLLPTMVEPGTFIPDLAAGADNTKTDAMLLVGSPDAVLRARKSRSFDDVVAWHVTNEP